MIASWENHRIDTRDLVWFTVLAQLENVTAASAHLGISQPTLSRSLARLERHIGSQLFDRHGKGLKLNRYGKIFWDHAQRALEELAGGETLIAELADPAQGEIHLGYQSWLGPWLIPDLIGQFLRGAPGVRFSLQAARSSVLEEQLDLGAFDLILTTRRPSPPTKWEIILIEDLFLAVPQDHRLAGENQVALADAQNEDFLTPVQALHQVSDELFKQAGFTPHVVSESYEVSTIRGLVAAGLGVAVLYRDHATERSDVVYLRLTDPGARREVGLAWLEDRPTIPVVTRFRQSVLALTDLKQTSNRPSEEQ